MKSESGSEARANKWRLKRTLRRPVDFQPIEDAHIRYAFAAYKEGLLAPLGFTDAGLSPKEFKEAFERIVLANFHGVWTLIAKTKKGFIPVGLVFAAWAPNAPYMVVTGAVWFSWASGRNKIEAAVNFFNGIRKEFPMMFYSLPEHKRMYEICAMHGIVRRVGTSYVAIPGKVAAVYETRAK